ncbi:lysozyme inhibitor LprI family protein [Aestuariibius insulae]|uniref:lysozyme inhibitor LprI family protein n=1 Tax=Aestuariibius insulae TaxID=2058287 RepID=UPI00345EEAEA
MKAGFAFCFSVFASFSYAEDIEFDIAATNECVEVAEDARVCIGLAANDCMETPQSEDGSLPAGSTTAGMVYCLGEELDWWDARLNVIYQDMMAGAQKIDAELETVGSNLLPRAESLRAMQRAWIAYRDANCRYEQSLWGGGTGAGPAISACRLRRTAEQTLYLETISKRRSQGPVQR